MLWHSNILYCQILTGEWGRSQSKESTPHQMAYQWGTPPIWRDESEHDFAWLPRHVQHLSPVRGHFEGIKNSATQQGPNIICRLSSGVVKMSHQHNMDRKWRHEYYRRILVLNYLSCALIRIRMRKQGSVDVTFIFNIVLCRRLTARISRLW